MTSSSIQHKIDLSDLINGGISGLITITLMQPFQVVKTSMMVIYNKEKHVRMREMFSKIKSEEGIKGFYRGFIPSLIKTVFGSAIYFAVLEFNKKIFLSILHNIQTQNSQKPKSEQLSDSTNSENSSNSTIEQSNIKDQKHQKSYINFLSSGMARLVQAITINPILVIKTRYEVVGFNSYGGMLDAFRHIRKEEGMRGFYSGLKTNIIKDVPASAVFYSLYEFFKTELNNLGIKNIQIQALISSISSSVILIVLTNPLDVIRTRQQFQHFSDNADHNYTGIIQGFRMIYRTEGFRGLFVGMAPRLIKKGIGSILVWTTYESLKK